MYIVDGFIVSQLMIVQVVNTQCIGNFFVLIFDEILYII